ncbi:phosphatase PAP2 family protein [Virgisporangium aliadipatigenens]|uniref:phosphatase PAP2 family protein n=1 Tax=Virgisporangium aliadipatigenens TaxID=741659 RepID=UPI0019418972|nr:phosphatase PAP2 family protein [Virgisporangium aliadipatigenens]
MSNTRRAATVITEALAPAVLVAVISPIIAWHAGSPGWGVATAVFTAGVPMAYVLRGVRRGEYDDHHVGDRAKRPLILAFAGGSVGVLLALMVLLDAPRDMIALVIAMLCGLALTLAVTYLARWKVSLHTAVASGTVTTLVLTFGPWLNVGWALVGAIMWSRVTLRAHTPMQTVVGLLLGLLAAGAIYPALR